MRIPTSKNSTAIVILIGIGLIILVGLVTFIRPSINKKNVPEEKNNENGQQQSVAPISGQELSRQLSLPGKIVLIDFRPADEFARDHLADSQNLTPDDLFSHTEKLTVGKKYVFIDYDGTLELQGFIISLKEKINGLDAAYLQGGYSQWKNSYFPTVSDGDPNSFSDQSKVKYITSDELKNMIGKEELFIIDLRSPDNFRKDHLKNAINIFLNDLENDRGKIPIGKKVILYDRDGLWAFKGAVRLFDLGIPDVYALNKGLDDWKQKGFEIESAPAIP